MFMLHKRRARTPLALEKNVSLGFYPEGVGGIDGKAPVVSIQIDEYTLYATKEHFANVCAQLAEMERNL